MSEVEERLVSEFCFAAFVSIVACRQLVQFLPSTQIHQGTAWLLFCHGQESIRLFWFAMQTKSFITQYIHLCLEFKAGMSDDHESHVAPHF